MSFLSVGALFIQSVSASQVDNVLEGELESLQRRQEVICSHISFITSVQMLISSDKRRERMRACDEKQLTKKAVDLLDEDYVKHHRNDSLFRERVQYNVDFFSKKQSLPKSQPKTDKRFNQITSDSSRASRSEEAIGTLDGFTTTNK